MVNGIRDQPPLPEKEIKSLFPYFPPRSLFDIEVASTSCGRKIRGKYIETFITPDSLISIGHAKDNLKRVCDAARVSIRNHIPITTLGGFTSIFLEGDLDLLPVHDCGKFTSGNTLTAALIVKGVIDGCNLLNVNIGQSQLLILGATGDLGSACAHYFKGKVSKLHFVARNQKRLAMFCDQFNGYDFAASCNAAELIPDADIIIAVTSSSEVRLDNVKTGAIIVDAGYPKSLSAASLPKEAKLFYGGMGIVKAGYTSIPDYHRYFYNFPLPFIAHGCVLEAMVLAFDNRPESYSSGRGNIRKEKMDEILDIAYKHGIERAPFYNDKGLWPV
ncbi:MAG: hypothetical protein QM762_16145 [Chryseolinea sp.]